MTAQPLGGADLLRLEDANYRRVTLLTAWTVVWLYVLFDLLFRWGEAQGIGFIQRFSHALPAPGFGQVALFLAGLIVVWLVFYVLDDAFEQAGDRSLCYRLGNIAHTRAFNGVYLCALVAAAIVAVQYRINATSFWLLHVIVLISCLVNFVEPGGALRERMAWAGMRLRLLFSRIPGIRRFVSLAPINARLAASQQQTNAEALTAEEQPAVQPDAPEAAVAPSDVGA
jgi:hypothetical protein